MSKYGHLLEPVSCEWLSLEGIQCSETFKDIKKLTEHVERDHIRPEEGVRRGEEGSNNGGRLCRWSGCGQVLVGRESAYIAHVSFHAYHSFLKLLGAELQVKCGLPPCHFETRFSNSIQGIMEVESRCLWDKGTCQQVFEDVYQFYNHVRDHVKKLKDFRCFWENCAFVGRDRNKVQEHLRTHIQEKVVACPTCGTCYSNNTKLKDHWNRQATSSPAEQPELTCSVCFKKFPTARLYREHTRKHINSVQCPYCDLTCQSPSRLRTHIRYRHVSNKTHQCPLCHKSYKTADSLSAHIETHGSFREKCKYDKCTYVAKSEKLMRAHIYSVHRVGLQGKEGDLFCCHVCDERFPFGRNLTVHLKKVHHFVLPPGHCRFRYVLCKDGLKRLQTVRLNDDNLYTPELKTFLATSYTEGSSNMRSPPYSGRSAGVGRSLSYPEGFGEGRREELKIEEDMAYDLPSILGTNGNGSQQLAHFEEGSGVTHDEIANSFQQASTSSEELTVQQPMNDDRSPVTVHQSALSENISSTVHQTLSSATRSLGMLCNRVTTAAASTTTTTTITSTSLSMLSLLGNAVEPLLHAVTQPPSDTAGSSKSMYSVGGETLYPTSFASMPLPPPPAPLTPSVANRGVEITRFGSGFSSLIPQIAGPIQNQNLAAHPMESTGFSPHTISDPNPGSYSGSQGNGIVSPPPQDQCYVDSGFVTNENLELVTAHFNSMINR